MWICIFRYFFFLTSLHAKVCRAVWRYQRLSYIEFCSMPMREQSSTPQQAVVSSALACRMHASASEIVCSTNFGIYDNIGAFWFLDLSSAIGLHIPRYSR
jgi:hypothetical protein